MGDIRNTLANTTTLKMCSKKNKKKYEDHNQSKKK